MEYEVGKPYMLGFWVYDSEQYFKVRYWTQVSMLEDGPSDCEWIIPGTMS